MEQVRCPVLVGRRSELDVLERALAEARRGRGLTVLVAGEAGIGKTRLCSELQTVALAQGVVTLWGGCSEADLSLPYLPIVEALGNHLAHAGFDSVAQRLGPSARELGALFPQFGGGGQEAPDANQARLRLFQAVLQLLVLVAGQAGLLLVVEDLHWADASTRELIDFLARRVRSARVLMVVTYRSDEMHRRHPLVPLLQGWRRSSLATGVDLSPLPPDAVATMVKETLGARVVRDETRDFLYQRSEGNPFVVEELVRAALDRGDFYRTAEGWSRRELSEMRLPETVRDSVLLRVERLDPPTVELVQAAAILGTSFNHRHLAAMTGLDTGGLRAAVEQCFREQLLEDDPHQQDRFRFRHGLTQEAVYDDLIAPERERLHERAADVLAAAGAPATEVANHLLAAKLAGRAVPYCLHAAKAAERSHAHADAAELYERALPHVRDRSESARLLVALGQESILSGQAARAERYLERAVAELAGAGAVELLPSARLLLGRAHWERGRSDLARSEYEKAREALEAAGPSRELATAYFRLGQLSSFEFDHAAVLEMSRRAIDMAGEVGDDVTRIWARLYLATTEWQEGRADAAIAICDETRREAEAHDLPWIAYNALYNSIIPAANSLRLKEAESRARLLQQVPPSTFPSYHVGFAAGLVLRAQGRAAEAAQQQSEAIAACQEVGATTFLSRSESELAVCLAMLGRLDEARRLLADPVTSTVLDQRTRQRASLRVALEAGDEQGMEWLRTHIDAVLASERLFPYDMLDRQVAALLWLGRIALARAHVDRAARPEDGRVWSLRAEARVLLAEGRAEEARPLVLEAAERFRLAGAAHEECVSLRLAADDESLRRALEIATRHGLVLEARRIRQALGAGKPAGADAVKEALESLGALPEERRQRLVAAIRALAASSDPRDAEAGEVLLEYYVRRAGSHETVAERLHLSRATFYRRLHRGLTRVSEVV